jgi:hypothetical protein
LAEGGPEPELAIVSPRPGEVFAWDPGLPAEYQRLRAVVEGGPPGSELVILQDGREVARRARPARRAVAMIPVARGRQSLVVEAVAAGRVVARRSVAFEVR